ncbi:hypothetical protein IPA_03410 [Ignicoccus pacificus DSM 13166]|uniref:Uncharacterized protein n=1 Tax=Ignicoccus pacificus DSM 13166 TaxID=940294 RepID=A0A977PJ79_9CREN|nr:hypothetical protein IPA_03410 [Ignicoccus pacificus DSM 13166]
MLLNPYYRVLPLDLTWAPDDVIKEVLEEIEKEEKKRKKVNRRRPTRKDLMRAILEALKEEVGPQDFVDLVYDILEERGFNVKFTNVKRIWGTYEMMVKKGFIEDVLGVCERC